MQGLEWPPSDIADAVTDFSIYNWNNVPDGSTLWLGLSPTGGLFTGGTVVTVDGSERERWGDEEIHPGPRPLYLHSPDQGYDVTTYIGFTSTQTATLYAQILGPSGAQVGETYAYTIQGRNNMTESVTLLINMA